MKHIAVAVLVCLTLGAAGAPSADAESAAARLKATRVKKRIRLQVVEGTDGGTKAVAQYALDESTDFHDLGSDRTFLASGPVLITLRNFNPLRTSVTVTVDDADDPTHATLGKLVESLLAMSTVLGAKLEGAQREGGLARLRKDATPPPGLPVAGCTAPQDAIAHIKTLDDALHAPIWSPDRIQRTLAAWTAQIDSQLDTTGSGPAAVTAALTQIDGFLGAADGSEPETLNHALLALADAVKTIDDALSKRNPSDCEKAALDTYRMLRLTNPYERQQTFMAARDAIVAIRSSLAAYAKPARWLIQDKAEFIARDSIEPTGETMKKVKVAVSSLRYDVPSPLRPISVKKEDLVSADMVVRRYSAWVPEIGVGLTYSRVTRPKYGTGTNDAGQTVIAAAETDTSSLDPTLLMNFVCGFCDLSAVTPMFQIGTSTSKTTPAVFLGGGIRLLPTSKGEFAIGVGFVLPWAKQLKDGVVPGTVIDGTADLENQLEWRRIPGTHPYVTLQYKF